MYIPVCPYLLTISTWPPLGVQGGVASSDMILVRSVTVFNTFVHLICWSTLIEHYLWSSEGVISSSFVSFQFSSLGLSCCQVHKSSILPLYKSHFPVFLLVEDVMVSNVSWVRTGDDAAFCIATYYSVSYSLTGLLDLLKLFVETTKFECTFSYTVCELSHHVTQIFVCSPNRYETPSSNTTQCW
jgi:hypothetical protein